MMVVKPVARRAAACMVGSFLIGFLAFASSAGAETSAADRLRDLYQREWQFRIKELPQFASSVGLDDGAHRLTPMAPKDLARRHRYWVEVLKQLNAIDTTQLNLEQRTNAAIFERQIRRFVDQYESGAYLMPLNSDWGFHVELSRLPAETAFTSAEDYSAYFARLAELPGVIEQYTRLMRQGLEGGMTIPRISLQGREVSIATHVVDKVEDSVFYQPLLNLPTTISTTQAEALRSRARTLIKDGVIPAYAGFLDFFRQRYQPAARTSVAATALPGGPRYYAQQVAYYTTLDLSPQQIHDIGLREVARIRGEMEAIVKQVGFDGSFDQFLTMLRTDPRFYAKSPRELIMHAAYIAKKMDGALPRFFTRLPRQPYGVEPVPPDLAPFFTVGRYVGAPMQSNRPGLYWVNTHDLPSRALYSLPALTLHEAVPGHHLQNALAQELEQQPAFRRHEYISAYGEGWGLYSEFLGIEAGIYATPYEHFGRLTYEMWRACRLVVDTGLHTQDWSRQRAVDFMAANTALSLHEINTEVDRYISWPGQALSYKLGELEIKRLRRLAEERLAEQFDLRAFHDVVLAQGSVPLKALEQAVLAWIEQH